ncbi:MAG: hypothetical protein H7Y31_11755 [Chitinophagaceae bacterium]|nr:hypothetical protein [Chitinophagaceae bacterium]
MAAKKKAGAKKTAKKATTSSKKKPLKKSTRSSTRKSPAKPKKKAAAKSATKKASVATRKPATRFLGKLIKKVKKAVSSLPKLARGGSTVKKTSKSKRNASSPPKTRTSRPRQTRDILTPNEPASQTRDIILKVDFLLGFGDFEATHIRAGKILGKKTIRQSDVITFLDGQARDRIVFGVTASGKVVITTERETDPATPLEFSDDSAVDKLIILS